MPYTFSKRINKQKSCSCSALIANRCFMLSQIWQAALSALNPNPTDSCPLYLNQAVVAALPSRVSRHNSQSSAHFVSRLVRSCLPGGNNRCIVVSVFSLVVAFNAIFNRCQISLILLQEHFWHQNTSEYFYESFLAYHGT